MPIPSWAVAAAVLIIEDAAMHYQSLTAKTLRSGLSDLGKRGGRHPWQTLRSDIANKHEAYFMGHGGRSGLYQVEESIALKNADVRRALRALVDQKFAEYRELLGRIVAFGTNITKHEQTENEVKAFEALFARMARLYSSS